MDNCGGEERAALSAAFEGGGYDSGPRCSDGGLISHFPEGLGEFWKKTFS